MPDREALAAIRADRSRLVVALIEAGATVTGSAVRCRFHDDKHASGGIHEHDGAWLYTCQKCSWNGDRNSGDIFDVVRRATGCDFKAACEKLGLPNGRAPGRNGLARPPSGASGERNGRGDTDVTKLAAEYRQRLADDPGALSHLWQTRGIDKATAERFGLGITGEPGRRFWTMPVTDGTGQVVAVKAHRADGQDQKSWWQPKGIDREHLFPIHLAPAGPVWLCPGELKALGVIGVGRSAIGITSGEGNEKKPADLPARAFDVVKGRAVAIAPDDDDTGRAWAEHVRKQLSDHGIEARIIDLGLSKPNGVKDVGDWLQHELVQETREPEAVAADLAVIWKRADPWYGVLIAERWKDDTTWRQATYITTGLRAVDAALGGGFRASGVHMLCGKTGQGKSQLAIATAVGAARTGNPIGFLSLELSGQIVAQLVAGSLGNIPRRVLAHGRMSGEYGKRLTGVVDQYAALPLAILDSERWPAV